METEAMRNEKGVFTEQSMSLSSMTSSPAFRSKLGSMFAELTDG
jgi:hypothetical protein